MSLTDVKVRNLKPGEKAHKVSDERGMYLLVVPTGGKLWRLDYRFAGKRKTLSLGVYPDVPLKLARERRDEARSMIAQGIDPAAERKAVKEAEQAAVAHTFEAIAREWLKDLAKGTSAGHVQLVTRRLEVHLFPELGARPIGEITPPELLAVLRRVADGDLPGRARGGLYAAQRARSLAGQVFDHAIHTQRAQWNPAHALRGALPANKVTHFAAVTEPKDIGALLRAIDGYQGDATTRAALQLAPLVFVRPGELRHMEWTELDIEAAEWRIRAEKMKGGRPHIVPLSTQAGALLRSWRAEVEKTHGRPGRYVFRSLRTGDRPMSENTLNAALRRLGYGKDEMTSHGFRGMASTRLHEMGYPSEVVERQLAHADRDSVRAAYSHAQYLPERRKMMQAWADELDRLKAGETVEHAEADADSS